MPQPTQKQLENSAQPSLNKMQALVAADMLKVNEVILSAMDSDVPLIGQIARHLIASGGKRIRPALTLLAAQLCGYQGDQHIRLAAAVEFIHSATLLHDDVVDESHMRRGQSTANDLWGNQASVLVGDFLLSRAFQLMVETGMLKVLKILSDTSAIIAQGEVKQLTTANNPATTEADYLEVITSKTAALFAAACELGAVVIGQEEKEAALRAYGLNIGIAFQLVDDILDYAANAQELGKNVGDDFREGKITLPVILAFAQGDKDERAFWRRTLEELDQRPGDLEEAMKILQKHNALSASLKQAESYCAKAREALAPFPASPQKDALLETVDFCLQRAY